LYATEDNTEVFNGYNPLSNGRLNLSTGFADQHKGKIFLQVESHGEAWYINPVDGKRPYRDDSVHQLAIADACQFALADV